MPTVTYIKPNGAHTVIHAESGATLMQASIDNNVAGILAECGGACQCATCHVYVEAPWDSALPPPSDMELAMLDNTASERLPSSRLSCEIIVSPELDGLVVRLPERQV